MFFVGPILVQGDLILAPMDGVSDLPFRSVCRELGSAMSFTEFINALDILQGHPYVHLKYTYLPQERPIVFQIFDSDPQRILEAALRLQEFGPDIIDVNMGCSANDVSGRGAGAGLLREPQKIARIFSLLTRSLHVPITGKIRLGWDEANRNYLAIAHIIEDNGGAMVTVHGRTKTQGYRGLADWDAIAEIKHNLTIPVIGNGDVCCVADIQRMQMHTGCDGVMIGRAAVGNPWLFSRLDRQQVLIEQVRALMLRHLERMQSFFGPQRGLLQFRKHASRYLSPYSLPAETRNRLLTCIQADEFIGILGEAIALNSE